MPYHGIGLVQPELSVPTLFDSLQVGDLLLPNRILMAPLTRQRSGTTRVPNALMASIMSSVRLLSIMRQSAFASGWVL